MWYYIIYIDGAYRAIIDKSGQDNKYGTPKKFKTKKDAKAWVDRRSYTGMTHSYEIKKADEDFISRFGKA